MPNRLAAIPKPSPEPSHLWIVADKQTAIAFHVLLDRRHPVCGILRPRDARIPRDATIMFDDLMPTPLERCRVIGANIVAHEKQDFHLGSSALQPLRQIRAPRRIDFPFILSPSTAE